ncbi:thioredoxin domain-containing protein [Halobacteriales archaeon QS_9_68_17]|nr:MAG: thioredoxin domain-containing protein [Halobacteriales archaeon QS_9_68_17]
MDDSAADTRVEWREWGPDAFAVAGRTGKPVLLSLSATWCTHCHEMDETTYSEPRIAANVNDGFVPVRVDVDRHPRVGERYNMGGFPSTVFLTPGGEVLTGAGYLGPDGMRQVIDSVRQMWDAKGAAAGSVPRSVQGNDTPAGELSDGIEGRMVGQLRAAYDETAGGWGTDAKFPMPRTIEFALKREREQALRSLNAVSANLLDDYAGGFYRYATESDWSGIQYEKVLDTNAAILRAFANGYLYTGGDEYREPAERTLEFLTTTLWTGEAFAGSQSAGASAEHYALDPTERDEAGEPSVDDTVFADWNAVAVDALLTFHAYTDDERARQYAERALEHLREHLIDGDRVVHYRDGEETGERGLLADHARVVAALARAHQVLGADTLSLAERLADYVLEDLQSAGSFTDGPASGPALLDRPLRPLDANVEFADALLTLHALTGENRYYDAARDAVEAFAGASDRFGPRVAHYATVAARLQRGSLTIAVADDAGSDLHRAALRMADHEKVVVPNDAGDEFERGNAYVLTDGGPSEAAATPDELGDLVADHAR